MIQILCYLNLTFFIHHVITYIFTKRLNRFYIFPSLLHLTDLLLFISSIICITWFQGSIQRGLNDEGLDEKTQ